MPADYILRSEEPGDHQAVEALYRAAFGPGRYTRTAYSVRGTRAHEPRVSFVAERRGLVIGAIRQSPITVGGAPALLLGPLAVAETAAKQGIGRALLSRSMDAARQTSAHAIVLVGDAPFYGPAGFAPAGDRITLPGPVEKHRVLSHKLRTDVSGPMRGEDWPDNAGLGPKPLRDG